ncbi:MAG: hypothetical protein ACI379_02525 [Nocardioides sp.]|uniref:hypothetical protein n=1 Tax=Nocardioides sp. TaxID=35761 RepID=UPI003EFBF84D
MRRLILGTLVPAVLVLGGCGVDEPQGASSDPGPCPHDVDTLVPAMKAAFGGLETMRSEMVQGVGEETMEVSATAVFRADGSDVHLTYAGMGEDWETVVVGDRVFLRPSADEPMKELPASSSGYTRMADLAAGMADVEIQFLAFEAGLDEVEAVGEETVEGVPTCHYRLAVDTTRAGEAEGSDTEGMPETLHYDMYLTEDDLPRHVTSEVAGTSTEMSVIWNEPVEVTVPAGS